MTHSSKSLAGFAARIQVSPPTTTLTQSAAILRQLQSYGRVIAFNKVSDESPEIQEMEVIYSSADDVLRASTASPLRIKVNHDLPDPKTEDPYNVRGLQSRPRPLPKTLICTINEKRNHSYNGRNRLSYSFPPRYGSNLHRSLLDLNAPSSLVDAFSTLASEDDHQQLPQNRPLQAHRDLMATYRAAVRQKLQNTGKLSQRTETNANE